MKLASKRNLAIGASGLVALAGTGGALAATQSGGRSDGRAYVNDVARHLNVAPSALTSAVKAALDDRIDAAVTAGRITPARATVLKQRVQRSTGVGFLGAGGGPGFGRHRRAAGLGAAARYLAISPAALRSELQSGKSLAQVASSTPGKSVDGLKAALSAALRSKLSAAVSAGRTSTAREQQLLAALPQRVDALVQRTGIRSHRGAAGLGLGASG